MIGKQVRIKPETVRKMKETKKLTKLKTYDAVINYLYTIRERYFKLKNK